MRHAVILAGGGGTRLWPASRRALPKQFLKLGTGSDSLLEATLRRLKPACGDHCYVVTAGEQVDLLRRQLPTLSSEHIIAEPSARNTAPALGLAAVHLLSRDPDAIIAAIPSDQHIHDDVEFRRIVDLAFNAAENHDAIVTIGIVPTRPETAYGYLKTGAPVNDDIFNVDAFVEKPDIATANQYFQDNTYLWNGGMFFTKARLLLDEIRRLLPDTASGLDAIATAIANGTGEKACQDIYPRLQSVSIDYGIMERTKQVVAIKGDFGWNDVGSWPAIADYCDADSSQNVILGTAITHDANNNIIVGDPGNIVALTGLNDLVVVQSGNAVLVMPREKAQDVRAVVQVIRDRRLEKFL